MSKLTITLELKDSTKENLLEHLTDWVERMIIDNETAGELADMEYGKGSWTSEFTSDEQMHEVVCSLCDSKEVLNVRWVNPNTKEISSKDSGLEGLVQWCEGCMSENTIIDKEDYKPNK